ncbi:hypothetical protein [Nocardioides pakistanensis]
MRPGVHLRRSEERGDRIERLVASLSSGGGGRVGLDGVLADLNRTATVVRVPGAAAHWGFRWDDEDNRSRRWWPQGITTSADHDESEVYDGRRVVMTSAYSKELDGLHKGSRISVVDLSDERPRYRHVLLVDVVTRDDGEVDVRPLKVHAGGIVWHGEHLHVAGTARGISTFRLDDVVRVGALGDRDRLGVGQGSFGYRYLLPVRFTYDAFADDGHERMRYSFLSLVREPSGPRLVAGEYGRRGRTTRLVDFEIDPVTSLLAASEEGHAHPLSLSPEGLEGMQGATVVDGRWYVTTSAGPYLRGSMYVGRPGAFSRRARVLPVGVEDLTYWPSRDELWSLSEYPGRRFVFAMPRARLR